MVRFHMQRHFDDLRTIERRLIAGKLDEARALAHLLARPARDPGLGPWQAESRPVIEAALALASASTIEEACKRAPRVSAACAGCHLRAQASPVFRSPPPPPDLPTRDARMARHLWATDRLWEAMVGSGEPAWRGGLDVLAETAMPFTTKETSRLARRLQDLAQDARARSAIDDRAAAYGELLVTCAACHTAIASAAR
jgi:cytochrome c553